MQIYIYTGEGGGKTTNALGLALRCIGHKKKVIIIQFMKYWKNIGEIKFSKIKEIKKYYKIYQFGVPGWIKIRKGKKNKIKINGIILKVRNATELDRKRCVEALNFTKKIIKKEKPTLLVLDEIILAYHLKFITYEEIKELIEFIKKNSPNTNIVLTGRYADKKIISLGDYVNEVKIIKMPKKISSIKGIQY